MTAFREIFIRPAGFDKPLDGLRALAIFMVLGMHANEYFLEEGGARSFLNMVPPFKGGWIGVPLFFTLSGYLIGGQIWKEWLRTENLKIGVFILRRGLRIWPLYYVALLFFYFQYPAPIPFQDLLANLTFFTNYFYETDIVRGSWSLSTEEQFYILAPIFIVAYGQVVRSATLKQYRSFLWVLFFLPILFRYLSWIRVSDIQTFDLALYMKVIYRPIHTNCEGLILGMIIANIQQDKNFQPPTWAKAVLQRPLLLLGICFSLMLASFASKLLLNFTGVALGFGALLWVVVRHNTWLNKILGANFLYPLAKLSYGIYLFHIPIFLFLMHFLRPHHWPLPSWLQMILLLFMGTIGSMAVCVVTYILVEKPGLLLRKRILGS